MKLSTIPTEVPPEHPRAAAINALSPDYAEMLHASVQRLNQIHAEYWSGTIEDCIEWLNELGIEQVQASFMTHYQHATYLNALLDNAVDGKPELAARLSARAIAATLYPIQWDDEPVEGARIRLVGGVFEEMPLPDPEPEEE